MEMHIVSILFKRDLNSPIKLLIGLKMKFHRLFLSIALLFSCQFAYCSDSEDEGVFSMNVSAQTEEPDVQPRGFDSDADNLPHPRKDSYDEGIQPQSPTPHGGHYSFDLPECTAKFIADLTTILCSPVPVPIEVVFQRFLTEPCQYSGTATTPETLLDLFDQLAQAYSYHLQGKHVAFSSPPPQVCVH